MRDVHELLRVARRRSEQHRFRSRLRHAALLRDVDGAPQNSIIGGATLWVLAGGSDEEQAGVAAFFNYLASAEVQAAWHQGPATCRSPRPPTT